MGFTEVLTIIFILLKGFGVITWSWWLVFLPEIIGLVLYVGLAVAYAIGAEQRRKNVYKSFRRY